jgi:hypothetical protein
MGCSPHKTLFPLRRKHTKGRGESIFIYPSMYSAIHPYISQLGKMTLRKYFCFKRPKLVPAAQLRWNCVSKLAQHPEGRHLTQYEIWGFRSGGDEDSSLLDHYTLKDGHRALLRNTGNYLLVGTV